MCLVYVAVGLPERPRGSGSLCLEVSSSLPCFSSSPGHALRASPGSPDTGGLRKRWVHLEGSHGPGLRVGSVSAVPEACKTFRGLLTSYFLQADTLQSRLTPALGALCRKPLPRETQSKHHRGPMVTRASCQAAGVGTRDTRTAGPLRAS